MDPIDLRLKNAVKEGSSSTSTGSVASLLVALQLRFPEEREVLTAPLRAHPRIELVEPPGPPGSKPPRPAEAVDALERLDSARPFDLVLLRGSAVSEEACRRGAFPGRLWIYYLPPHDARPGGEAEHLRLIASAAERVLCQTEPIRALAEALVPEHASKLTLLPPMIPPFPASSPRADRKGPIKLLYAGKFAPEYYFLEMVETFRRLRRTHPDAELHLVGDKVHDPPDDPAFKPAAEPALAKTANLVWHGAVSRERVGELLGEADLALSIRHPMMARSKELSTKVLEYGAAGCPALLNRHPPLRGAPRRRLPALRHRPGRGAGDHAATGEGSRAPRRGGPALPGRRRGLHLRAHRREAGAVPEAAPGRRRSGTGGPPRLVIAGHDLKFMGQIPDHARAAACEIREDHWWRRNRSLAGGKPARSCRVGPTWSSATGALATPSWYSRNLAQPKRLVIRFHRMERETDYPASVVIDRVACVAVFVGRHLLDEAAQRHSWPNEKLQVVPNAVDVNALRRRKLPGSSFNLGLLGYVPAPKTLDRALDILELLRASDRRYRLIVKGQPPWAYPWMLRREDERRYFQELYRRIKVTPLLRGAVSFEEFGPNVPAFLRKVGIVLSTSDHEGHQVALAEGMASGCLPVVMDRPGAREQYSERWVHESPEGDEGGARAGRRRSDRRAASRPGVRRALEHREGHAAVGQHPRPLGTGAGSSQFGGDRPPPNGRAPPPPGPP